MINLELKTYVDKIDIRWEEGKKYVFDPIRKKLILLLPEELIRQALLYYFINILQYPTKRIQIEKGLTIGTQIKRFDIVVYDKQGAPKMLVECKSYSQKLDQNVFDQIADYNRKLKVQYLMITNGISTYVSKLNYETNSLHFVKEIPDKAIFS